MHSWIPASEKSNDQQAEQTGNNLVHTSIRGFPVAKSVKHGLVVDVYTYRGTLDLGRPGLTKQAEGLKQSASFLSF